MPHLKSAEESGLKSVYIDHGAIPFILKGANLMRPGISKIDEGISENDIVLIRDEEHKKIIAIGQSLKNSSDLVLQKTGISINVLHYMGDEKY